MNDRKKTNSQLIEELAELRERLAAVEGQPGSDMGPSDSRWCSLVANAPVFILVLDRDHRIRFINHTEPGESPEEVIGKTPYDYCLPEYDDRARSCIEQVFSTGQPATYEARAARPNGNIVWYRAHLGPIFDGDVVSAVSMFGENLTAEKELEQELRKARAELEQRVAQRTAELEEANRQLQREIEQRQQAEEELRRSEERFRVAFEEAPVGMVIGVQDGIIAKANRAVCEMSGYSEEELIGRHVRDLTHPDDRELSAPLVKKLLAGAIRSFTLEKRYLAKGGRVFWAQATTAAVQTPDGKLAFALGIVEDITERKQALEALERERRTLLRMLRASDHERQTIAYDIHDGLAQQLAAAILQFQAYEHLDGQHPDQAQTAYDAAVQMVKHAHSEARRLISGVRPPALDESGVAVAIAHFVHEQRAGKGPQIEYHDDVSFDRLLAIQENAIYRIAQEGVANAFQHSKSAKVSVSLVQQRDQVRLEVRDWGVGFDPNSVDESRFGLEGIKERTRLLGGTCSIESEPGKGTCLRVVLPILERD